MTRRFNPAFLRAKHILVALACLLILQLTYWIDRSRPLRFVEIAVGDTLAPIALLPLPGHRSSTDITIDSLFVGAGCGIVHFFTSTCPSCRSYAPQWTGVDTLVTTSGQRLPIAWIGLKSDVDADFFLSEFEIGGSHYIVKSLRDYAALGVAGTPRLYVINRGIFRGRIPRNYDEARDTDILCQ
jgi:hypothetical protein